MTRGLCYPEDMVDPIRISGPAYVSGRCGRLTQENPKWTGFTSGKRSYAQHLEGMTSTAPVQRVSGLNTEQRTTAGDASSPGLLSKAVSFLNTIQMYSCENTSQIYVNVHVCLLTLQLANLVASMGWSL